MDRNKYTIGDLIRTSPVKRSADSPLKFRVGEVVTNTMSLCMGLFGNQLVPFNLNKDGNMLIGDAPYTSLAGEIAAAQAIGTEAGSAEEGVVNLAALDKLTKIETLLTAMSAKLTTIDTAVDLVNTNLGTLETDVESTNALLTTMDNVLDTILTVTNDIEAHLGNIDTYQANISSEISAMEDDTDGMYNIMYNVENNNSRWYVYTTAG
tara:strand:+ start:1954 stop:2577 length:624 start_codon:yes stop_codon:yes gene_type:complete